MESSRPGVPPVREARRFPVVPVVFGLVVAVVAVWITVVVATRRDPEDTVEAYLTAIADKDVEGALALVTRYGSGVPYGDSAAFLTAGAVSDDWWVVSVTEVGREFGSTARVEAVIAGPGGTASGEFVVEEDQDEWLLQDPFVTVRFPASPLTYVRVNDVVLPKRADAQGSESYSLFPGTYRFYGSVPGVVTAGETGVVAAFPDEDSDPRVVVPPTLTAEARTVARVQEAVEEHLDECATFATPVPHGGCPFGTDGEIDTPDGRRVTDLHGLTWEVATYPTVEVADDRTSAVEPGFALTAAEPGTVTLTGGGEDTDGNQTTFTVTCEIDLTGVKATVDAKGGVTLVSSLAARDPGLGAFNTCRRNA